MKFDECYCAVVEQSDQGLIVHDSGPFPLFETRAAVLESTIGNVNHKLVVVIGKTKGVPLRLSSFIEKGFPLNTTIKTDPKSDTVFLYDHVAGEHMLGSAGRVWSTTVEEMLSIINDLEEVTCTVFFSSQSQFQKALKSKKASEFLSTHKHTVKNIKKMVQLRYKVAGAVAFSALIDELKMMKDAYGEKIGLVFGMD